MRKKENFCESLSTGKILNFATTKFVACCRLQKKILVFVLSFMYSISTFCSDIDSLLQVAKRSGKAKDWNQVALYYEEIVDTSQLRIYAQRAYRLALLENNLEEKGNALLRQSTYEEYSGNLNVAIEKSVLALECFRELNDENLITEATSNIAYYCFETGQYDRAIEIYHDIINVLNRNLDIPERDSKLSRSLLNISLSYYGIGNIDSVIRYNHMTSEAATKARDTIVLIEVSNQLGAYNASKTQYKDALLYYEEALRLTLLVKFKK